MTLANASLTFDPVWPWSLPVLGVPALAGVAFVLVALTVATYLAGQRATFRQFLAVLALRLAALFAVYLLMLRPALATLESALLPSKLLFVIDGSQSMGVSDEFNNQSRWEAAVRLLEAEPVQSALEHLQRERRVGMVYYRGAEELAAFDPAGQPDGKRTDMGRWLSALLQRHGGEANLRGAVLLTDGADNGTDLSPVEEAKRWRGLNVPVHAFGLGSPTTTPKQRDVYFLPDRIATTPAPVPIKNKLTVRAVVNAPGFEHARATLRVLIDDQEAVPAQDVTLTRTEGNEVKVECDAPAAAGEYKVTLQLDPLPGEVSKANNEVSTYFTATKEGVSVLWVEGKKRAFEPTFVIRHALSRDPRFRVEYAERLVEEKRPAAATEGLDLKDRHFDVVVIGDVSGGRFAGGKPETFVQLQELVRDRGAGLLVLGGYESFANSDWQNYSPFAEMLPVRLDEPGQLDGPVRVRPTDAGFDHYVLRLADDRTENLRRWEALFAPLDGMTRLGSVKDTATVLATRAGQEPVLVSGQFGAGRVLAFAGDTTWKAWRRSPEAVDAYDRFWRRVMVWLARQEEVEGSVWVKLDARRVPAATTNRLGFSVGLRDKAGRLIHKGDFRVQVAGPGGQAADVNTFPEGGEERGYWWKTSEPGEYTVTVQGKGADERGAEISGEAKARFLVYAVDLENLRPAADHDLLARVAAAGGGEFHLAGERDLRQFLAGLAERAAAEDSPHAERWPDWRRAPPSDGLGDQLATLWSSGTLACYLLFCACLCLEWYLRRRWRMV